MALAGQKRQFMSPPVGAGVKLLFSHHFRGRGHRRKEQYIPATGFAPVRGYSGAYSNQEVGTYGRQMRAVRRMPDIDDPRPPIVGWEGNLEHDGSLPIRPYYNTATEGRKLLQGLYKKFKEHYNQHYTFYPIYGGGAWNPQKKISWMAHICRQATVVGDTQIMEGAIVYPNTVIRGDLNRVHIGTDALVMEGCTLVTDGHPRNVHLPGRVSRINEGECRVGKYAMVHPNCVLDSAFVGDLCEIGEGSVLGYNSVMEYGSSLEPGTVLLAHQRVPRFEVWGGSPARKVGARDKNTFKFLEYQTNTRRHQAMGIVSEQPYRANPVLTTRSAEKMEAAYDRLLLQKQGNLPEEAKEMLAGETREVPLWEEYKNVTRVNTRVGVKRGHDWTVDPNKGKWVNHY